jgi:hypothetical protein
MGILFAFLSGFICYHFPMTGANGIFDQDDHIEDIWWNSSISFTLCIHVAANKLFLEASLWNSINNEIGLPSNFVYYICATLINY